MPYSMCNFRNSDGNNKKEYTFSSNRNHDTHTVYIIYSGNCMYMHTITQCTVYVYVPIYTVT
jgi:hypothetical protein